MRKLIVGSLVWMLCPVAGVAGEGVVALQTADPSCPGQAADEIYSPCDNGTVTDNRTGLVWLADAECLGLVDWFTAMDFAAGLSDGQCGLTDGSSPGEWRLPSRFEWSTMIEAGVTDGCDPTITNDIRTGCWSETCFDVDLCSFTSVQSSPYWSSTSHSGNPVEAWGVGLSGGAIWRGAKTGLAFFWPVRGGQ